MRKFLVELRDLNEREHWTYARVWYEPHAQGGSVYTILDEFGNMYQLEELSSFDRAIVEKNLIYHLLADEQEGRAC